MAVSFECTYFATCAGGIEPFVAKEVALTWDLVSDPVITQGKVAFRTVHPIDTAPAGRPMLCSAERLFVQVFWSRRHEVQSSRHRGSPVNWEAEATAAVQSVDACDWWRCERLRQCLCDARGQNCTAQTSQPCSWRPPDGSTMSLESQHASRSAETSQSSRGVDYRIAIKVSGSIAQVCNAGSASRVFGDAVASHVSGWTPCPTQRDALQVYVHWNDSHLIIGLAMGGPTLSERGLPRKGLRSTVAWSAAYLALGTPPAAPRTKDLLHLCDPFCGVGSLLSEVCRDWHHVHCLAGDVACAAIMHAKANLKAEGRYHHMYAGTQLRVALDRDLLCAYAGIYFAVMTRALFEPALAL